MRKLASIAEIAESVPLSNSDHLSLVTMNGLGWQVVTGRDEYKPGDLVVYFEIDSYLPADDERYAFLRDRCLRKFMSKSGTLLKEGLRIKTVKLRGELSQGLVMPLDKFPEVTDQIVHYESGDVMLVHDDGNALTPVKVVGADVTKLLHVEHYDEISEALRPETGCVSVPCDAKMSDFPTAWVPKSDEERLQCHMDFFGKFKGVEFEVTEKRDGSSCSFGYCPIIDADNPFMVCSRNMRLKPVSDSGAVPGMWRIASEIGLAEKCKEVPNLMFQAEWCGPGINSNRDLLPNFTLEVFRIYDVEKRRFVPASERRELCKRLGIQHVPVLKEHFKFFDEIGTMDAALEFADGKTGRGNKREGIVAKSETEPYVSFKVVSNRYLLSEK